MSQFPKPKLLLSFDFDGTLIDPASERVMHPDFFPILRALREEGAVWVINTGRSLFQTIGGVGEHDMPIMPDFIAAKERELYQPTQFNRWVDLGDWNKKCHKEHTRLFRSYRKFFNEMAGFVNEHTGAEWIENEAEPAGIVARDNEEMDHICDFIRERSEKYPLLGFERNTIYLRFGHADYNKGTVLQELGRLLGLGPECIFVAGDNHNDISMLDPGVAHRIACPSNSIDEVKHKVYRDGGFVATAAGSAGMVQALRHFFVK